MLLFPPHIQTALYKKVHGKDKKGIIFESIIFSLCEAEMKS